MRWLLLKDIQILRRSPALMTLLVAYPIALALMIGFALSSPPGKPKVAIYSGVATGRTVTLGAQRFDTASLATDLYASVTPIKAASPAAAIADVRRGRALAALIIPRGITQQIEQEIRYGTGNPTVRIVINSHNPLERDQVHQAIRTRVDQVQQALQAQILRVIGTDLRTVIDGGKLSYLGRSFELLGLRNARTIAAGAVQTLGGERPDLTPALQQVVRFADIAITGLSFAAPAIGGLGQPLTVHQSQLAGVTTPTASYAVAIAALVSLMFVALLLAAAMLALERSEHTYPRLVRGLVTPGRLLGEKALLAALTGAAVTFLMSAVVSIFVPLEWGRVELWLLALAFAGIAFGALGVALGAVTRDVSAAALSAILVALPVAFVALIPGTAVSGALAGVLNVISFLFPFRAGLNAVSSAFSGGGSMPLALLHLAVLAAAFWALARLSAKLRA